ncbi:UBX domain-containing protein 6 isoform X2 [Hyperolius riggenbachi]|uniref:UBX domain-containing protein 6 isoform X2 n=1 Tax=Hyperolius riggenbachi TaxID=752182 RepID=UPI0035A3A9D4
MPPNEAYIAAGAAAVARLETGHRKVKTQAKGTIQLQGAKQREGDREVNILSSCKNMDASGKEFTTVCNVLFKCPLTGKLLRKDEKDIHIRKAIEMMSYTNPVSASIMKIYTFNKDQEMVKLGVETVTKYLNNIIDNPNEEKYHTIKISNKVFQEKIKCLEGSLDFFEAVGFEKKTLPLPGQDIQDEFFVLSFKAEKKLDDLLRYRDLLTSGTAVRATLERQPRVFAPSLQAAKFDLPDDFYNLTVEEIKREQQLRKEKLERESVLRTKAMRQREEQREMKKYRYTVLRTRFPDGYILQDFWQQGIHMQHFITNSSWEELQSAT